MILLYTYSMVAFSLIPSCIPGRIARYSFMVSESKVKSVQNTKWEILRYLSHEMRTPLNVICTGTKFELEDCINSSSRIEHLSDIHVSAQNALNLLDNIMIL